MRPLLMSAATLLFTTGLASAQTNAVETCLFEEEDWAATLEACSIALAGSDHPVEQGRYILHRGIARESLGDMEGARLDYILSGDYRPDWFRGYANAAIVSDLLDEPEAQLRWAQAAIDAEPDNPRAYIQMLVIATNGDDTAACDPVVEAVVAALPDPVDWPFQAAPDEYLMGTLALCLADLERNDEALQAFQSADFMGLDDHWFLTNYSYYAQYVFDRPDIGAEHAIRALETGERNLYDADTLIYALVDLNDIDGALEIATEFADLLDEQEEEWGTRNIVGWELFLDGRLDEAATVMEAWVGWAEGELAAGRPVEGYVWDTVAHIRAALGDTEGATEAFRLAFEHYGDAEAAHELYSYELTELGFDIGEGDAGLLAALDACAATGPSCRLIPDEEEAAAAAE